MWCLPIVYTMALITSQWKQLAVLRSGKHDVQAWIHRLPESFEVDRNPREGLAMGYAYGSMFEAPLKELCME